jgi:T4-like virus tail tube protein gp19
MRTRTLILVAVAVFAVLVGGFVYVALGGGSDERRLGAEVGSYTAGKWALEVGGVNMGFLRKVDGCGLTAEVVKVSDIDKASGAAKYGVCKLTFGVQMDPSLYTWVTSALNGTAGRKSVVLHQTDFENKSVHQLRLPEAGITRFALPAFNAASTEAVYLELHVSSDRIETAKGTGAVITSKATTSSKNLLAANFRVTVGQLPTTKVSSIDSWSFDLTPPPVGVKVAVQPELGPLDLLVSEADVEPWSMWVGDLVKGSPTEKSGSLEVLNSARDATLVKVDFKALGLAAADLYGASEIGSTVSRRRYSMYVEGATITVPGASA